MSSSNMLGIIPASLYSNLLTQAKKYNRVSVAEYTPLFSQLDSSSTSVSLFAYSGENLNLTIDNTNSAFIYNGTSSPLQLQLHLNGSLSTNAIFGVSTDSSAGNSSGFQAAGSFQAGSASPFSASVGSFSSTSFTSKNYITSYNAITNFNNQLFLITINPGTVLNMILSSTSSADAVAINVQSSQTQPLPLGASSTLSSQTQPFGAQKTTSTLSSQPKRNDYTYLIIIAVAIFIIGLFFFIKRRRSKLLT